YVTRSVTCQGVSATSSHLIFPITPRQVLLICYCTKEESHAQLNSSTDFQGSPSHLRAAQNSPPAGLHFHGYSAIYTRRAQSRTHNRKATDAKWHTDAQANHTVTQGYNKRPHQLDTDTHAHTPATQIFTASVTHPLQASHWLHCFLRVGHAAIHIRGPDIAPSHTGTHGAPHTRAQKPREPQQRKGANPTQSRAENPRRLEPTAPASTRADAYAIANAHTHARPGRNVHAVAGAPPTPSKRHTHTPASPLTSVFPDSDPSGDHRDSRAGTQRLRNPLRDPGTARRTPLHTRTTQAGAGPRPQTRPRGARSPASGGQSHWPRPEAPPPQRHTLKRVRTIGAVLGADARGPAPAHTPGAGTRTRLLGDGRLALLFILSGDHVWTLRPFLELFNQTQPPQFAALPAPTPTRSRVRAYCPPPPPFFAPTFTRFGAGLARGRGRPHPRVRTTQSSCNIQKPPGYSEAVEGPTQNVR
uniref:Uncharacterized protein n=1 Tax=Piliocolobus tephrosceles TaxID=591936 RepID=A0A8C9GAP3_9PRIM